MEKDFQKWNSKKMVIDNSNFRLFFQERDVWFCHLGANIGFEQDGKGELFGRPVVVFKKFNNMVFWAIPLTTKKKAGKYYAPIKLADGIFRMAILSQLRLLDAKRLYQKLGVIDIKIYEELKEIIVSLCRGQ